MTRDSAVSIIANRLGQRTGLATQVVEEMKLAQERLEGGGFLPWFLLQEISLSTTAHQNYVSLPTGFLRLGETQGFWLTDVEGAIHLLVKEDLDVLKKDENLTLEESQPEYFSLVDKLYLFPTPDAVYSLKLWCYVRDTVLSTDIENNWLANASSLLIAETGVSIARFLRDIEAVGLFSEDRSSSMDALIKATTAREESGRVPYLGG